MRWLAEKRAFVLTLLSLAVAFTVVLSLPARGGQRVAGSNVRVPSDAVAANGVDVWDARTSAVLRLPVYCDPDEIALGGERLIWSETAEWGLSGMDGDVLTNTTTKPRPHSVHVWIADSQNARKPNVRADGSLSVFADYQEGRLYRLSNGHAVPIGRSGTRLLAIDGARIAIRLRDGSIELVTNRGNVLRQLPVKLAQNAPATLAGRRLVIQNGRSITVYDATTGRLKHLSNCRWHA